MRKLIKIWKNKKTMINFVSNFKNELNKKVFPKFDY